MTLAEQVKNSVDIVRVIGEYVRLKKVGAGHRWVGLCPFHTEKTPSFSVHGLHQFYKCFGCGAGGDVFKFVMEMEGIPFFEALQLIAERNGIRLPARNEFSDEESRRRQALLDMHALAADFYHSLLMGPVGETARAYLESRGVAPQEMEDFRLGFAPGSGRALLEKLGQHGYPPELLELSGLVLRREDGALYDRFRQRVMFPIHSQSGKVIAFGGRALGDAEPKYLNSSETPIYQKSAVLYNLHRAKEAMRRLEAAVLVEGYLDAIAVWSAGVQQVVAVCGTALSVAQVRMLRRHTDRILVNLDADEAGAGATERYIQTLLAEGMQVRVVELAGGDPHEFITRQGAEAYRRLLGSAPSYYVWLASRARKRFDMRTAEGRVAGFKFLLPAIQSVSDRIERAAIANEVADYLGIDRAILLEELQRSRKPERAPIRRTPADGIPLREKMLLRGLVHDPQVRDRLLPALEESRQWNQFATAELLRAVIHLHRQKPDFQYADLEGRLTESQKELLAAILLADNTGEESFGVEQAAGFLNQLEKERRQAAVRELKKRIQETERSGDLAQALRLTEELNALLRCS